MPNNIYKLEQAGIAQIPTLMNSVLTHIGAHIHVDQQRPQAPNFPNPDITLKLISAERQALGPLVLRSQINSFVSIDCPRKLFCFHWLMSAMKPNCTPFLSRLCSDCSGMPGVGWLPIFIMQSSFYILWTWKFCPVCHTLKSKGEESRAETGGRL
jgi:hypothetical protein